MAASKGLGREVLGSDVVDASGTTPPSLEIVGFELSLDTASVDQLDHAARSLDRAALARWMAGSPTVEEAVLLSTCHRVELIMVARTPEAFTAWTRRLPGDPGVWRVHRGQDCVRHLYEVTAGRRSIAVGEREIRSQVLDAAGAVLSRHPRPLLRDLLRQATRDIQRLDASAAPPNSVASLAAEVVQERLPGRGRSVVVIGAGTVGVRVAEMLRPRFQVSLVYRSRGPDPEFLHRSGVRAIPERGRRSAIEQADGVVAAARTAECCLSAADLPVGRPLLLVDLGIPRNIDPSVRGVHGLELIDLGDLRGRYPPPPDGAEGVDLRGIADHAWQQLGRRLLEGWVDVLRRRAEEVRQEELVRAAAYLETLSPSQREAVDRLARRLVDRLLGPATARLRALPGGPEGEELRRLAVELMRPEDDP